jgi:DNA polymerase (family 10)
VTNAQIAAALDEIADILEFQGANPFRVRAYRNASRTLGDLGESIEALVGDGRDLTEIEGIGEDLAGKIETLVKTGSLPQLVELRSQVPKSVLAMMRIPGLGPKKAAALYRELSIKDLDMLKAACESHKVRELKGFGEKTEEIILKGLGLAEESQKRIYWAVADEYAQALLKHMRGVQGIGQMEVGGSYRRGKDTVGDLDLLVVSSDVPAVMDRFGAFSGVAEVLARGETKMVVRLDTGLQVDLRVVPAESFGAALQYFTGSKQHNIILRGRAKDRGLKVSEWGVFRGEKYIGGRTEEEVYKLLDLPWIPPELREARKEFEWAEAGALPELIEVDDIQGDLHMHTSETDGAAALEEMVEAAKKRGLKYIAITDHSKRVTMANGLDGTRLRRQWGRIDELNDRLKGIKVLKGVEVDILEKGGLDLADDVLAEADWVVASLHYGQNQPREKITKRIVEALENPHVSAIGHPTGRLLERRSGYDVDLDTVFAAAKKRHKMLELNANPARLDLDDVACAAAKEHGIPIVINTDAHSPQALETIRYGVLQARRAGLTKDDVVNTRPWSGVLRLLGRK